MFITLSSNSVQTQPGRIRRSKQQAHHLSAMDTRTLPRCPADTSRAWGRGTSIAGLEGVFLDHTANQVSANDFDAVFIPGGRSPDKLRNDTAVVTLVRNSDEAGSIIAAVCHGPQLLIEAGLTRGRTMTSWPSLRTDVAESHWPRTPKLPVSRPTSLVLSSTPT